MDKKHGYVQIYLNAQRRHDAMAMLSQSFGIAEMIEELNIQKYRVAFDFDEMNFAARVTITTKDPDSPNRPWILSEFAKDPETALAWAYYYHAEVCAGGAWTDHSTGVKYFKEFQPKDT